MTNSLPIAGVNVLRSASPEKIAAVTDHGRLVHDLAERGMRLVVTNRDTLDNGEVLRPEATEDGVVFHPDTIDLGEMTAIHNRIIFPSKAPNAGDFAFLNSSAIKEYVSSKHRLYEEVLQGHQAQTELVSIDSDAAAEAERIIDTIQSERMVIKSNSGTGGESTAFTSRNELAVVLEHVMGKEKQDLIVQPELSFGKLPKSIRGLSDHDQVIVERARTEGLLAELRMLVVKIEEKHTVVPVLRVVVDKGERMGSQSDVYVDVMLGDDLAETAAGIATAVVDEAAKRAGDVSHVLAAIDYYFNADGEIKIMEANMRSPQIPRTEQNPRAGREIHVAVADALTSMSQGKVGK